MPKPKFVAAAYALAAPLALLVATPASAAVLTVGPGATYAHIQDAINAASAGDTIQVKAGTYNDEYFIVNKALTITAINGTVLITNDQNIPNGKAEAIVDADLTISGFAFSGAKVSDNNGAGIRYEFGNLTVNNCYFFDNQDGILAAANANGVIIVENSEFSRNGIGDGFTHALYVNQIKRLNVNHSYFHDTPVGHYIKSRAQTTIIQNNGIIDGWTGTSSYNIDIPNGGVATINNNVIEQGPQTQNPAMIHFGGESPTNSNSSLGISGNTFLNDDPAGGAVALFNQLPAVAQLTGNSFWGLTAGQIASGSNSQSGNVFLTSEPTIQKYHLKP